ncbi:hypothetical protein HMPREF2890_06385 [Porphyromonas sp. HMSC065F10]|nr:hypothetical protein HMPREF2890_06385 [Porphyromonas sp. HMSC065F10]
MNWRPLFPLVIGLLGLVLYISNLIELERKKDTYQNPPYVSARRREIYLWIVIFSYLFIDNICPVWGLLFNT